VPSYAVPDDDIKARLVPAAAAQGEQEAGGRPVLDPRTPFSVHSTDGEPLTLEPDAVVLDERVDVIVDGERRPRPVTPWS
jgi:hypothetical protein